MKPFASAVSACVRQNIEVLVDDMHAITTADRGPDERELSRAELRQIFEGVVAMIEEAAEERPPEVNNLYVETIVPSIVRSGTTAKVLSKRIMICIVRVGMLLARELPRDIVDDACRWYYAFMGQHASDAIASGYATKA